MDDSELKIRCGARIRRLRMARHVSIKSLGQRIGVTAPAMSQYEHGHILPTRERRVLLEAELGEPFDEKSIMKEPLPNEEVKRAPRTNPVPALLSPPVAAGTAASTSLPFEDEIQQRLRKTNALIEDLSAQLAAAEKERSDLEAALAAITARRAA
jgi:transcriptional regulator with XRE-family HTH domain